MEKNKKIELLESTATLFFPEDSQLKIKDPSTLEVSFSKEKYPVLGINLQCFDNPKLNNDSNIKKFLVDDEDITLLRDDIKEEENYPTKRNILGKWKGENWDQKMVKNNIKALIN